MFRLYQPDIPKVGIMGSRILDIILETSRHFVWDQKYDPFVHIQHMSLVKMKHNFITIDHNWMNKSLHTILHTILNSSYHHKSILMNDIIKRLTNLPYAYKFKYLHTIYIVFHRMAQLNTNGYYKKVPFV